jgi:hypothetical protein
MGKDKEMEETLNEQEEEEMEMDSEEEVEGEEEDEIDLEDMTEDELKDLIEDVIEDMVRAGELEAGEKFEADEEEEIDFEEEDEEEIVAERAYYGKNKGDKLRKSTEKERKELVKEEENINEIDLNVTDMEALLALLAGGIGIPLTALASTYAKDGLEAVKRLVKGKKSGMEEGTDEMDEMKKEIEELASTLSETKLLNAKLLYTNKIFRAKNLNETQKVKVLEAFDKASSVKEAKLIYETLTTVRETKTAVTESMRGMASKAVGMAPEKKPILEVNDQFARWQILAGIKKN